ncbi:MAG: phospholipase [Chitinophagales bacterium]
MKKVLLLAAICLAVTTAFAQDFSRYKKEMFTSGKDTLRYRILYPENYQTGKAYPVLVFLHGSGERGRDNEAQLSHGADLFLKKEVRDKFQSIIIFPQCPPDSAWSYFESKYDADGNERDLSFPFRKQPRKPERMVKQLTDSLIGIGVADKKRIYIGGLSLGGFGTYDLLIRYPNYYAAAFSICGACNVELMSKKGKHQPLWIFHGAKDDVVSPAFDRDLYASLKKKNKEVKCTEYPDANHNSWDPAFAEPELLTWLFSFTK